MPFLARTSRTGAQRPERPSVTVLAACLFQPCPTVAHEIAEAARLLIESRMEERQITRGERIQVLGGGPVSEFIQKIAKDVGASVVIRAIALVEVRHIVDGVLEDAGAITHPHHVIEPWRRQVVRAARQCPTTERSARRCFAVRAGVLEGLQIPACHRRPDHLASQPVRGLPGSLQQHRIIQILANSLRDGFGIAEWHEDAAAIREQFLRMPVGRGDNCLPCTKDVSQRAGSDLCLVQIRRHVDVCGTDEFLEVIKRDKAVVEDDVLFHTAIIRQSLQSETVTLALSCNQVRMRGPEHEIDDVWMSAHDLRQSLDHMLDPLPRPDQSESEQDHATFHTELGLEWGGVHERDVRDAMGNDVHLRVRHLVGFAQNLRTLLRHHNDPVAASHKLVHDRALSGVGITQHGMKSRHHRHPHFLQQRQKMAPGSTTIDAELMLHAEDIRVVEVQKVSPAPVGIEILLRDFKMHPGRILVALLAVIHST